MEPVSQCLSQFMSVVRSLSGSNTYYVILSIVTSLESYLGVYVNAYVCVNNQIESVLLDNYSLLSN